MSRPVPFLSRIPVALAFALGFSSPSDAQVTVTGASAGVNAGSPYATLAAAFTAINGAAQTGNNIVISITANTSEPAAGASLGAGAWATVTINPVGARTVSGAATAGTPLINLNGADNVTIDGLNSGGNSLEISNTTVSATAGTSTIRFIADATSNTVTRCTLRGSSTGTGAATTATGTILFSTATTTGNDNNTISNCDIGPAGANLPSRAITSVGTTTSLATMNSGIQITSNNIFDFFLASSSCFGIRMGNGSDNWTVSNNRIYQSATRTFTSTALRYTAIFAGNTAGNGGTHTITGNIIGFANSTGTGITTITGSSNEFRGIDLDGSGLVTLSSIQGNTISGISQTSSRASTAWGSNSFIAIKVGGPTFDAPANVGTTTGNTIGSLDGSSSIVINASSTTANTVPAVMIYNQNYTTCTISNNSIGSITINNGGSGTVVGFRGIVCDGVNTDVQNINDNVIGGTALGSITDNIVGNYAMYGIQNIQATSATYAPMNITGNMVRNLQGASNGAVVAMSGILVGGGGTTATTVARNTVHSLVNNGATAAGAIYGIDLALGSLANIVERNHVHSLQPTGSNAAYQVFGMVMRGAGTATFRNNMVRLGLSPAGASITTGFSFIGIREITGGSSNYYHNSVYIGGTGVASVSNTYAFLGTETTLARDYRNNIFSNARSNASGGIANVAIRAGGTVPSPTGLTSNFNVLRANGTDGVIGVFNLTLQPTLADWQAASGMDGNSITDDPLFIAPNGTAVTGDLHIQKTSNSPIEGAGTLIASVTNDFDNDTRSTSTPVDIGADAGNFAVWYSQGTGNVSDPIWARVPVGVPGPASWPATMIVQNSHIVTNTGAVSVMDLTVDAGGSLSLGGGSTFDVIDDAVAVNGSLNGADNSLLQLNGSLATTLSLASTTSLWDLTANTAAGTTLTGDLEMRGTLLLSNGNFNASSANVTLNSTATETGRLGPVAPTASYTGNMRIERYRPYGLTNWMLMGSPIQGRTVNNWQDDFITAGYPGSQFPNFDNPVGSNILWPSIRWYDETNTGANENDGLQGVSSNTQALSTGQGFAVWAGTGLINTNAFSIDLEGAPPVIASTPISLPMSYTNTGNPSADGWNLMSNPLPSPIDFDQIALGADVEDYITYYNPTNGNTAQYDISLGIFLATNGATNTIQSMQGFFLKATGSAVTTTVEESDKVSGNGGGMFGLTGEPVPALRLSIASGINTFRDETVIAFHEGTPELEASDVPKYVLAHDNAPQIATLAPNGTMIAINAYGTMANGVSIPVSVNAGVTGQYTITITEQGELGLTCISLEDLVTGAITPMNDGATYTFQLDAAADETVARFLIHATAPALLYAEDANCGGTADGQATIVAQGGPHDITWRNSAGDVLLVQNGISNGVATITGLDAGGYSVSVTTETCGTLVREFAINAPFVLEAQAFASNASCASTGDGSIDLMPLGGMAPYEFLWSDAAASTTEDLTAAPGSYAVTITDANGCTWTSDALLIGHDGPVASMLNTPLTALVNEPVQFSAADADASFFWSFGDGATSDVQNPMHAFELPGTYTVVLSVSNGDCSDVITADITIELSTSVTETDPAQHRAWAMPQGIVVEHAFGAQTNTRVELLDATGRVVIAQRMGAQRIVIPSDDLASGLWFVRLTSGSDQATLRVPLTR